MTKFSKKSKIYIAGHKGMVGSAIWRSLKSEGYLNLIGESSKSLDLRDRNQTFDFVEKHKPDVIINAAH